MILKEGYVSRAHRAHSSQDGYTLLEVLFATLLLLVVAVSVMPLFSRSIQSNLIGGRASEMAAFVTQDVEVLNQKLVDHEDWDLDIETCPDGTRCVSLGEQFWLVPIDSNDKRHLTDGRWTDDETEADDDALVVWRRAAEVRKYTYSDVLPGIINIDGTTLTPRGHPELFDVPIVNDDGADATSAHLVEVRVAIDLNESGVLDDSSQRMTVGHFRAY